MPVVTTPHGFAVDDGVTTRLNQACEPAEGRSSVEVREQAMCPICLSVVASNESDLVSHLVAGHPAEATVLGLALTMANIVLSRQPAKLLLADLAVFAVAVVLARANRRGWA
jgi:hypothetical protein